MEKESSEAQDPGTNRAPADVCPHADGIYPGAKCDQCRGRKIRCDRKDPCSNCKVAKRPCTTTEPEHKPRVPRQRVLISPQYERKIDQIEERLASIEHLLRSNQGHAPNWEDGLGLAGPADAPPLGRQQELAAFTPSVSVTSSAYDQDGGETVFEGDLSLAAHTAFASEFLENAGGTHPGMAGVVASLRQMVSMQDPQVTSHEPNFPHQKPLPPGGLRELPMPPMQLVVALLRDTKEHEASPFRVSIPFITVDEFTEYCRRVYFATQDFPPSTFIVVNNALHYLFLDRIGTDSPEPLVRQYRRCADMCRDNLETALANFSPFPTARRENVEALLVGAARAVEHAKPTLALQMTATASHLCLTLGYHRAEVYKDTSNSAREAPRPIIFWLVYILDKSVSLSLGRASMINDCDITVPRDVLELSLGPGWRPVHNNWIRLAELQGLTYERLYSPAALSQPEPERVAAAWGLADQLKVLAAQAPVAVARYAQMAEADEVYEALLMVARSDEVSIYSTLTLVYRALPPLPGSSGTFNPHCIDMARETMRVHQDCMALVADDEYTASAYLHWTILYAPFTPFIVVFCHTIETSNTDDLQRLEGFVQSLEGTRGASHASEKLHRLCQVLYNVAVMYVESKHGARGRSQPGDNEMNVYLNALGFMAPGANHFSPPVVADGENVMMNNPGMGHEEFQTSHLGEWFSGNRHMMRLLEGDMMSWSGMPQM